MNEPALPSTAEDIIRQCPRFRILVIGKSGVGKSSLINRAFNVDIANVSHQEHGRSDINTEITSPHNPRFVLHDSQGFEPGEDQNLRSVQDFVRDRSRQPRIVDRLHAIWLCVEIPRAGARLFELGDEVFLEHNLQFGGVPVVVVFTKYDLLVAKKEMDMLREGIFDQARVIEEAGRSFEELCVGPLNRVVPLSRVNSTMSFAKVSDRLPYNDTLSNLVQITYNLVSRHVEGDVWLIWAMAQRANMQLKVEASIRVGKQRYWLGLASSVLFSEKLLRQCLSIIHKDIVSAWHFRDDRNLLLGDDFKNMLWNIVTELGPDAPDPNVEVSYLDTMVTAAAAMSAPFGVATAALGMVVMAGKQVALWYDKTPSALRLLMGYIVDLTLVMERAFWVTLSTQRTGSLSMRELEEAFSTYKDSEAQQVHRQIREYVDKTSFANHMKSNMAHEEAIRLIRLHLHDDSEARN